MHCTTLCGRVALLTSLRPCRGKHISMQWLCTAHPSVWLHPPCNSLWQPLSGPVLWLSLCMSRLCMDVLCTRGPRVVSWCVLFIVLHINIRLTFARMPPTFQYYHACAYTTLHMMSEKRKGQGAYLGHWPREPLTVKTSPASTNHRHLQQIIATFDSGVHSLPAAFPSRPHR